MTYANALDPAHRCPATIMQNGAALDIGLKADISESISTYLRRQGQTLGIDFEGMTIFNFVFHNDRVLLLRLAETVTQGQASCATPLARPLSHAYSVTTYNRSPIDRVITDEVSVYSVARTALQEQTGIESSQMSSSNPGALHTPVVINPRQTGDYLPWLYVSIFCERPSSECSPARADGLVATSTFWASEEDVQDMEDEEFYLDIKDDILTAFEVRRGQYLTPIK